MDPVSRSIFVSPPISETGPFWVYVLQNPAGKFYIRHADPSRGQGDALRGRRARVRQRGVEGRDQTWTGQQRMFDLMDFHMTTLALAGALDKQPTDSYINRVDQSSFLLADGGQTKRHATFSWSGYDFSVISMSEFKACLKPSMAHQPMAGLTATTVAQTGAIPWVFNLNVDPQEQKIGTNRQYDLVSEPLLFEVKRHQDTFKKYQSRRTVAETLGGSR